METWTDPELDHIATALSVYQQEWGFSWKDWQDERHDRVCEKIVRMREALREPSE